MKGKVLVTGAYGLLGSHAVRELIRNGYHVRAFGRDEGKLRKLAAEYESSQIEVFCGDFCNAAEIEKACDGIDYVVHCGALLKGWGRRSEYIRTNVDGTKNVLDACEKHNVKRLVHTSSPSAHALKNNLNITEEDQNKNNRLNYYIESKLMAEELVSGQDRVPYSMIRPRGITGIGDKNMLPVLINVNRQIGIPLFQKGKVLVDLVCAENAALALRLCMEKEEALGQAYNITNGEPKPVTDWIYPCVYCTWHKSKIHKAPVHAGLRSGGDPGGSVEAPENIRQGSSSDAHECMHAGKKPDIQHREGEKRAWIRAEGQSERNDQKIRGGL